MGWKTTQGLRGELLEEMINMTNEKYIANGLAIVQKIPTPIKPVTIEGAKITLAYFEQKSTVDYLGIVQGIGVCFDAKECNQDRFPLKNIHQHQMDFMKQVEKQEGVSFFVIYFKTIDATYYVPYTFVASIWDTKKSFNYKELDSKYILKSKNGLLIPYLDGIQTYLASI